MLNFISGRVRSGKTSFIISRIQSRRESGTLFVVPEQYSHSMERLLCEKCGNSVSGFAEVTSFRRLAAKIKSEIGGVAAQTVGGGRRILLLHRAINAVAASLKSLEKTATSTNQLEKILDAIDEFKAYGIKPAELAGVTADLSERCGEKLSDLALIYAAYENELNEDEFDAYDELAFVAESLRKHRFFEDKTVYFDGFSGFTAAEYDIIESSISQARDVYVSLELSAEEDTGAENGIFDKAFETKKRISELAKRCGVQICEEYLSTKENGALQHLDCALFFDEIKKHEGNADEITITRADSPFEECELAAAYVLDCVREKGARFRDFSVAVTGSEEYLSICEMVFSRYGIPVYVATPGNLTSKPVIALVLAAFDCIVRGFRTDAVMEYLKTGFSGVCSKSLDVFENYLYTWSPKPSAWAGGRDFTKNPLGLGAEETDLSRSLLRIVNRVRKKIYEPIERLRKALLQGRTGEKCAEALYEFINEINLPRRCGAYAYLAESAGRLADAQEYERIMSILCDAIDSIGRVCGDEEISAEQLYQLFKIVVSQYELDTIPASLDCVNVSELSRADGERCKFRIILGANEGSFPKTDDSAGILSDNDRAELLDCGIELAPGLIERIFEQYRTVHSVVCSAERELYISSSALGANGEENAEASVASRLREIFSGIGTGLSLREARLRARTPCFDESIVSGELEQFWQEDEEYSRKLCTVRINSKGRRGPICERENIEAIFGSRIYLSASRADLFSSCRYAYFLKYGLRANVRERAEITAIEAGSLMHYVLEHVILQMTERGDYNTDIALTLAGNACKEYIANTLKAENVLNGRMEFLLRRLERTVKSAVEDICRELSKSKFVPKEFELKFTSSEGDLPPIEIHGEKSVVSLRGAVDRIDTYEKDGKMYFRVIDYKSGKKEFSLDETVNGIGMQMLLYMFAIEEMGEERYGMKPHPAGVMYVPIAQELARGRGENSRERRREGVVLRDMSIIDAMESGEEKVYLPVSLDKHGGLKKSSVVLTRSEFDVVKERMKSILARIGDELCSGEIEPNPYTHKNHTACDWCDYKNVCAFDEMRTDDKKRKLCEVRISDILENAGGEADEQCALD